MHDLNAIALERADPSSVEARHLLQAMSDEIAPLYGLAQPADAVPTDVLAPGGGFVLARLGGVAVGCGALWSHSDGTAEIKRMFVSAGARGRGVGRAVLDELEALARDLGYRRIVLETGTRQPAAISLYESAGYRRTACYGPYATDPFSLCFEKALVAAGGG